MINHWIKEIEQMKRFLSLCLAVLLLAGTWGSVARVQAKAGVKDLCKAAMKATGNTGKLKYKSDTADSFPGFTVSDRKKVSSIIYVCDAREVYSICVVQAGSASDAKALLGELNQYKKQNSNSGYLKDYSKEEQGVLKNALCGKKGKTIWYIAMSGKTSVNKKGQKAIRRKL